MIRSLLAAVFSVAVIADESAKETCEKAADNYKSLEQNIETGYRQLTQAQQAVGVEIGNWQTFFAEMTDVKKEDNDELDGLEDDLRKSAAASEKSFADAKGKLVKIEEALTAGEKWGDCSKVEEYLVNEGRDLVEGGATAFIKLRNLQLH